MAFKVGIMTQYFTPPTVQDRPTFNPDSTEKQKELWQHFENRFQGVNVWVLSDGTVVQDLASVENSDTDLSAVYPWNPDDPSGPYVTSYFIDPSPAPQVVTAHTVSHNPYPVAFFYGGAITPITSAQATLLTDYTAHGIGYGGCIS